jgi:hypothetical protein
MDAAQSSLVYSLARRVSSPGKAVSCRCTWESVDTDCFMSTGSDIVLEPGLEGSRTELRAAGAGQVPGTWPSEIRNSS